MNLDTDRNADTDRSAGHSKIVRLADRRVRAPQKTDEELKIEELAAEMWIEGENGQSRLIGLKAADR